MSYNRKTKTYKMLVRKLAKQFEHPTIRKIEATGKFQPMTFDEIIEELPNGTPRYLIEDALALVAEDATSMERYHQEACLRSKALAASAKGKLDEIRRPKIQLVRVA